MSVADVDIRSGRERLLAAIGSADAFQYSGAIALFVIGSAGSLVTQVGIFESAQNFWASIVVAFLLNLVMGRLVNTQRDQIAVLKAFGYGNRAVGLHYLWLGLAPVAFGAVAGSASGVYFGRLLTGVFGQFYHFPVLRYVTSG